jgi:endonuclease/exonuclease/phosphatase family metal-dependent hydrolase
LTARAHTRHLPIALLALTLVAGACSSSSGHPRGASTAPPLSTTDASARPARVFTLVSMNVLHGATCDDGARHCAVADRFALMAQYLERAGCPDVVTLEEAASWWRALIVARLPTLCDGAYHFVSPPITGQDVDVEVVLSRLPTSKPQRFDLAARTSLRRALRVDVRTPLGQVVLVVTHVGTGADDFGNGGASCSESKDCPPPCNPAASAFTCQIVQLRDIAETHPDDGRIATLIAGDLNLVPTAAPLRVLTAAGFVDTYRAASRTECKPATGEGCTSGRDDTHLATLRDPNALDTVRVDDIFLRPTARCRPFYGLRTGLFASTPSRNGPGGIVWISDHAGAELDLSCR